MRPRTRCAVIAALALAIAATTPAVAATPSETPAPTPIQVIQAPPHLKPAELDQLTGILVSARGAAVVLRIPGPATIAASEDDLKSLWSAVHRARFYVVQQGDAKLDGAAAILSAFAAATFRQPGADAPSGLPGELWPVVKRLTDCLEPCARAVPTDEAPEEIGVDSGSPAIEANLAGFGPHLADLLDERAPAATTRPSPARDDDGGPGPVPLLAGLLILVGGGVTAVAARPRRRRDTEQRQIAQYRPDADPGPLPVPPGPPAPRPPARSGRGRRARVVSALDPEGYVELDRCLQRARWASAGTPAAPGEWVDIETRGRRLWAYAAARPKGTETRT